VQALGSGSHPNFRLFLTSEISLKLPVELLRLSNKMMAEAPTGIKASLNRFFSSIKRGRFEKGAVYNRLYLLLGWAHAVIQERLRYVPTGWTEKYEFTEADSLHAMDAIDALIADACTSKHSIDPDKLPWDAMRTTLCKGIFGGRITNDCDQEVLDNLIHSLFIPSCFDTNFHLVNSEDSPYLPDGTSMKECFEWIDSLDNFTNPVWIGLDKNAETERSYAVAQSVKSKVDLLQKAMVP